MKRWFYNLPIKSRHYLMIVMAVIGVSIIAFNAMNYSRVHRTILTVMMAQRVHNVAFHRGVEEFYEYLYTGDSLHNSSFHQHLELANELAYGFSMQRNWSEKLSNSEYVSKMDAIYGSISGSVADVDIKELAGSLKLMGWLYPSLMDSVMYVAHGAAENGIKVSALMQQYIEDNKSVQLVEIDNLIKEITLSEDAFSAQLVKLQKTGGVIVIWVSLIVVLLIILVITYISLLISKSITRPVEQIVDTLQEIVKGKLDVDIAINSKDEIGVLADSFRRLQLHLLEKVEVLKYIAQGDFSHTLEIAGETDVLGIVVNQIQNSFNEIIAQTEEVATGNFDMEIVRRGENDTLSDSLGLMTNALKENALMNRRQQWMQQGQADLNDLVRGEHELDELARSVIGWLVKFVGGQLGVIYIKDEQSSKYNLLGSYAYTARKNSVTTVSKGEGIVGQAILEQQRILLTQVPDDYVAVNSGLGNSVPDQIVVVPCGFNDEIFAVVEIGVLGAFTADQLDFLERVSHNIAVSFYTVLRRRSMEMLLAKTQEQTEELQVQQEELRQANEEMETQTKALRESENQLQAQQEELRATNEELEERTHAIEKQRDDIKTKNEKLEIAQQEIEAKALALEKSNQYKSEFLANMSHELRTPLNSILILSQLMAGNKAGNLTEKQITSIKTIYSSGSSLLELINDILDLSKIEAGRLDLTIDEMDVQNFISDISSEFNPLVQDKGLKLNIQVEKDIASKIYTDTLRLQQVVRNLISNAVKFTSKGVVSLTVCKPDNRFVPSHNGYGADDYISFKVQDTGIGIPLDKQKSIFEAFTQADGTTTRRFGGTGLGLTISKSLANMLGGDIYLESEMNKGSLFVLTIPEKTEENSTEEDRTSSGSEIEGNREKECVREIAGKSKGTVSPSREEDVVCDDRKSISKGDKFVLVIEDDASFGQLLYDLAHERGFKCLLARNGETGLHYAEYYKPDAIILDIGLPGINGWEVMDRLKQNPETVNIPVHFMSGAEESKKAKNQGAIGYLQKPVSVDDLNLAFSKISSLISSSMKQILVVEDDDIMRSSIVELIDSGEVEVTSVATGKEALDELNKGKYDCFILDLGLSDMSGIELLKKAKNGRQSTKIPVIIYTGRDLTRKEEEEIQHYTDKIIIKGVRSSERLLAETMLFIHKVESGLPDTDQVRMQSISGGDVMKGKKVLIVDDDMRNVFALTSVLEDRGIDIVVGRNGREGVDRIVQDKGIDLVLMDIMMPVMNGYEAMEEIRKNSQFKKLPIIALTAKAMKGDREKVIKAGANDYLTKPVDIEKLVALLKLWLYR